MLYSLLEARVRNRSAGLSHFRSLVNDQIIASYQSSTNVLDSGWIQSLGGDCMQMQRNGSQTRHKQAINSNETIAPIFPTEIVELVDRIVDKLHGYALEFNLAVGWNLHVSATPPTFVTEALQYNARREAIESQTLYRARLATRLWSLVVRADGCAIQFLLVPTQVVMGLSKTETYYEPVMTITVDSNNGGWSLDGEPFELNSVNRLCQALFKLLVAKCMAENPGSRRDPFATMHGATPVSPVEVPGTASGVAEQKVGSEFAVSPSSEQQLSAGIDTECSQALQPESRGDLDGRAGQPISGAPPSMELPQTIDLDLPPRDPRLISIGEFLKRMREQVEPADAESALPPAKEPKEPTEPIMSRYDSYNDVLLNFTMLLERVEVHIAEATESGAQAFRRRDLTGVKRACIDLVATQANEKRVYELRSQWLTMKAVSETLAQHDSPASQAHRALLQPGGDTDAAMHNLIEAVDTVVEVLSDCGSEAFAARDFLKVERFRHHAMDVIQFKQRLITLRDTWSKPTTVRAVNESLRVEHSASGEAQPRANVAKMVAG